MDLRPILDNATQEIRCCVPADWDKDDARRALGSPLHTGGEWTLGETLDDPTADQWRQHVRNHHQEVDTADLVGEVGPSRDKRYLGKSGLRLTSPGLITRATPQ